MDRFYPIGTPGQPLTEALRQVDGEKVACLLLVRDDFWMSICSFLAELEIKIQDGRNALALPLFDAAHARNVLAAIGRAYGRIVPEQDALPRPQRQFLRQSVELLARNDRVVCVHLAVFAEMMKQREWSEDEAYQALRKMAMEKGLKIGEVARQVVTVFEMIG